jgi:hypothetical protein
MGSLGAAEQDPLAAGLGFDGQGAIEEGFLGDLLPACVIEQRRQGRTQMAQAQLDQR